MAMAVAMAKIAANESIDSEHTSKLFILQIAGLQNRNTMNVEIELRQFKRFNQSKSERSMTECGGLSELNLRMEWLNGVRCVAHGESTVYSRYASNRHKCVVFAFIEPTCQANANGEGKVQLEVKVEADTRMDFTAFSHLCSFNSKRTNHRRFRVLRFAQSKAH